MTNLVAIILAEIFLSSPETWKGSFSAVGWRRHVAEYYAQQVAANPRLKLAMNQMPVAGINTTYSSDTLVSDSAVAGTVLATGYKTNNGIISELPDGRVVKSLI